MATRLLLLSALAAAENKIGDTTLTVYHVNPLHEGVIPLDMDTADIAGDAFFDLRSKVAPIECANATRSHEHHHGGDCNNGEVTDSDLVITKLTLQLKSVPHGDYARCNICLPSGRDPLSGLPCKPGAYICTCGSYSHSRDCTNETTVGSENITKAFGGFKSYVCSWHRWITEPWTCWSWPVVSKTRGMWYSTTKAGWCGAPGADPSTCTWDAKIEKVVNKSCSDNIISDAIEAYDRTKANCFDRCPYKKYHPELKRNTSEPCWIYCYYSVLLGASNLLPSGELSNDTGMPREQILDAFGKPFKSVAEGGCPAVPIPPSMADGSRQKDYIEPPYYTERQRIQGEMYRMAAEAKDELVEAVVAM